MQLDIINFFEPLVVDRIQQVLSKTDREESNDFFTDVACIALNKLPARYVRHAVDATFYMSSEELANTTIAINDAVDEAIAYIDNRRNEYPDGSAHKG
jgi:hypothetical protein